MQSELEQMYLMEIIVEEVDVIEEGILDKLREQVEIVEQQLKQPNAEGKDNAAKDNDQPTVPPDGDVTVKNKDAAGPNSNPNANPLSENAHPQSERTTNPKRKIERTAPVNVLAQFLDFPALEIKEKEFKKYIDDDKSRMKKDIRNLQQGKSCLFSMLPKDIMEAIRKHPVVIQVHRESSSNEPAHLIGVGHICLGQQFIDTIALGNTPTIAVTTTQGDYDVTNIFGDVTATVSLVIRISCVGTSITTQFEYNKFDGNFKFTSSESVLKNDTAKSKPGHQTGQKEAIFHKDDALGIFVGPPPDCKLKSSNIPWTKFLEEPLDIQNCGPKRLFKEQARKCFADDAFRQEWTPSLGGCCGGQPSRTLDDYMPAEFGTTLPPEIKKLLPSAKSDYDAQPDVQCTGLNFNWRTPPKPQCEGSSTRTKVCCEMTGGPSCTAKTPGCPCMSSMSEPVYVCSDPKVNLPPPLEEAGPYLKCSPNYKPETSSFKRDLQYIPCPNAPGAPNTGNVTCGLEELVNQQNLMNLLQPSLMAPVCPPDSSGRRPSLCTCPKVPTVVPKPVPGGVVRCECTNILTAMKPIELPYTCPKQPEQQVNEAPTCPPCPPVPIKLPPPAPECPLSQLLKESQDERAPQQTMPAQKQGISNQHATTTMPTKLEVDSPAAITESSKTNLAPGSDNSAKSGDQKQDHPSEMTSFKSKQAHKVLQDEVTRATTSTTYSSEPQSGRRHSKQSKQSKTGSSLSSIVTIPAKKKKKRQRIDEGRGCGYTPTRFIEPPKELNVAYTPTAGRYPDNTIGHRNCIPIIPRVPKRMGWLWNIKDADGLLKPGRGWRPGSIQTNVMKVMDNLKTTGKMSSIKSSKVPIMIAKAKSGEQHTRKAESSRQMTERVGDAPSKVPYESSPTLHVHKKHGLHYVSMIPPPKDPARKRLKVKRMNSRGDTIDESDSDDSHPAQFRIDTKHRDTLFGGSDLYQTDDTSTVSEDSYQMEVVAPSTLRHRQPQPVKTDMEVQVTETDLIRTASEPKGHDGKEPKKAGKHPKKKISVASRKGKKAKTSIRNAK